MKNKIIVAVQKIDFDLNLEMESLKEKTKKAKLMYSRVLNLKLRMFDIIKAIKKKRK